jgi:chromosome segregation ATPase
MINSISSAALLKEWLLHVLLCTCGESAAELASCQVQQGQLQRELNQLRAMTAEKDERLADAAGGELQLRQQVEQLRQQLREAGEAHGRLLFRWQQYACVERR